MISQNGIGSYSKFEDLSMNYMNIREDPLQFLQDFFFIEILD